MLHVQEFELADCREIHFHRDRIPVEQNEHPATRPGHLRHDDASRSIAHAASNAEFAVILARVTLDQAHNKGAVLSQMLREKPPVWNGQPVNLNFSCGVYELHAGASADSQKFAEELFTACMKTGGNMDNVLGKRL